MSFDLHTFIAVPSQELLNLDKKSALLDIAAHYELTNVSKSMLKQDIKIFLFSFWLIRKYLILLLFYLLLSLHIRVCKCESLRCRSKLNSKNKIRARKKIKLNKKDKCRLKGKKIKFDTEEKERERQYNLRMKELAMQNKTVKPQPLEFGVHFDVTKHIRLVPLFQEKEVDKYFLHFEKK